MFVDFGRELYVPWQLGEGKRLFTDLAYFNGPLSPWINALWFRLFGVSLRTLVVANLAQLAVVTALLYCGLRWLGDRLGAVVGVGFFLAVFAFAQYLEIGNFNYVTPYSHEMTHGILLSLAALTAVGRYLQTRRQAALVAVGLLIGLVFLTKPELFLAVAAGCAATLIAHLWTERASLARWSRVGLVVSVSALAAPTGAFCLLAARLSAAEALRGVLGAWPYAGMPELRDLQFYRDGLGVDRLGDRLLSAAAWGIGLAAFVGVGVWLGRMLLGAGRLRGLAVAITSLAPMAVVYLGRHRIPWAHLARPLPYLLVTGLVLLTARLASARRAGEARPRLQLGIGATLFALLLLLKMFFNARFLQYGFVLAMPGAMLLVVTLVSLLPAALGRRRAWAPAIRAWAVAAVLATAGLHLWYTHLAYARKLVAVGEGGDSFVADARGRFALQVLDRLAALAPSEPTLAVLPEGVMVNYLARLPNPTPFVNFMPPELIMFGEVAMLEAFRANPPDLILVANRPAHEYGLRLLGRDYGVRLMAWIEQSYELVEQLREPSIAGEPYSFGLLLRRRSALPAPDGAASPLPPG